MKGPRLAVAILYLVTATTVSYAQGLSDPALTSPNGDPVAWSAWLGEHGSAVVLLWGSWTPGSEPVLVDAPKIQSVAADRGLDFVVVALQERYEVSRAALGSHKLPWLHDRHGALLKVLRVYDIPAMVIVSQDGAVLGTIEASSQALKHWKRP